MAASMMSLALSPNSFSLESNCCKFGSVKIRCAMHLACELLSEHFRNEILVRVSG